MGIVQLAAQAGPAKGDAVMSDSDNVFAGEVFGGDVHRAMLDSMYDGVYLVDADRKILYWNSGAERLSGFKAAQVVGKSCFDDVLCHVDAKGTQLCHGQCPLAATLEDGKQREREAFLHHSEGHRVPLAIRVSPIKDASGEVVGAVEVFSDASPRQLLREQIAELSRLASIDALTELPNRRFADNELQSSLDGLKRYGWSFGVLFVDIDHFKRFNDEYGHNVGDQVLKVVARTLASSVRSSDVVARWGGEEFVVLLRGLDEASLAEYAVRCRAMVERSCERDDGQSTPHMVTVSIGGTLGSADDDKETIIARADSMMRRSKNEGRNRVSLG